MACVASKGWISKKFSPCLCLPPASTVWHWAQAFVKIFLPASALIFYSENENVFLSRILGSLYFLRTDHFILSRWDTWEEKLFHPNFDLPSPQPYGLEIHKFCRDINFWQPDTPKDMSSDSFLTRLWYESRRYILPHQWQSQQMLFAIVFATWPSQLFGSIPAFLTSPVNKWIWVLLSTASPQIASPKSPPSKNEGKVGSAFLCCIKRHTGKVSSIFKSAKKSNLLFSC